jgi:serine/threonine protein kinase
LIKSGQAKAVVHEKNVVARLRHPFINGLVGSFQASQNDCFRPNGFASLTEYRLTSLVLNGSSILDIQDETFLYMLMNLVQGGELYNVIHKTKGRDKMPEADARFYAAGIHEALGYMHRSGFVYRDLKPGVYEVTIS